MPGLDLTSKTVYVCFCPNISLCLFLLLSNYVTSLVCQPAFCQLACQVFASWISAFWCLLNACWCLPSVSLSAFCQFVCIVSASWMPACCLPPECPPDVCLLTACLASAFCQFVCIVSVSWMPAWCLPSVKLYTVMICILYFKCTVRSRSVGYFWTVIFRL